LESGICPRRSAMIAPSMKSVIQGCSIQRRSLDNKATSSVEPPQARTLV
jgi:hypothetical protein